RPRPNRNQRNRARKTRRTKRTKQPNRWEEKRKHQSHEKRPRLARRRYHKKIRRRCGLWLSRPQHLAQRQKFRVRFQLANEARWWSKSPVSRKTRASSHHHRRRRADSVSGHGVVQPTTIISHDQ